MKAKPRRSSVCTLSSTKNQLVSFAANLKEGKFNAPAGASPGHLDISKQVSKGSIAGGHSPRGLPNNSPFGAGANNQGSPQLTPFQESMKSFSRAMMLLNIMKKFEKNIIQCKENQFTERIKYIGEQNSLLQKVALIKKRKSEEEAKQNEGKDKIVESRETSSTPSDEESNEEKTLQKETLDGSSISQVKTKILVPLNSRPVRNRVLLTVALQNLDINNIMLEEKASEEKSVLERSINRCQRYLGCISPKQNHLSGQFEEYLNGLTNQIEKAETKLEKQKKKFDCVRNSLLQEQECRVNTQELAQAEEEVKSLVAGKFAVSNQMQNLMRDYLIKKKKCEAEEALRGQSFC